MISYVVNNCSFWRTDPCSLEMLALAKMGALYIGQKETETHKCSFKIRMVNLEHRVFLKMDSDNSAELGLLEGKESYTAL